MHSVMLKASDKFTEEHADKMKAVVAQKVVCRNILMNIQITGVSEILSDGPLLFALSALDKQAMESGQQAKVLETLGSRSLLNALAKPSDTLSLVMTAEELVPHDLFFTNMSKIVATLRKGVEATEFADAKLPADPTIFDSPWEEFYVACMMASVFEPGAWRAEDEKLRAELARVCGAYSRRVMDFLRDCLTQNPWLSKAVGASKVKGLATFPAHVPEFDEDFYAKVNFSCEVVETVGNDGDKIEPFLEMRNLKWFLAVGAQKSGIIEAAKKGKNDDPAACVRSVDKVNTFFSALNAALENCQKVPTQRLFAILNVESEFVKGKFATMFGAWSESAQTALTPCLKAAASEDLDLEKFFAPFNEEELLKAVNCQIASVLKSTWGPLVNWHAALLRALTDLDYAVEFEELLTDNAHEDFLENYTKCRNKVCDCTAARALTRPLPPNTTRASLCRKAATTVASLEGSLSPRCSLAFEQFLSKKEEL